MSQSDCILLATNGDIQAINTGSPNVHIYLHTVQKVDRGKGKMVGENPCPIIYHSINKYEVRKTLNIHSPEFPICALIHQIFLFVH